MPTTIPVIASCSRWPRLFEGHPGSWRRTKVLLPRAHRPLAPLGASCLTAPTHRYPNVPRGGDHGPCARGPRRAMVGISLPEGGAVMDALHGILLGYDGSPGSEEALGWAAREARSRGSVLTACLAWAPGYPASATEVAVFARRSGERTLARGLRRAQDLMGAGEIRPLLADTPAATALCELSGDAEMVVVGSRGQGGLAGLLLGSVSSQVAAHAHGRVVVVRGNWQRVAGPIAAPIVVGTEGSAPSAAAVEFAFEEATLRGTSLVAVCALADAPGVLGGSGQIRRDFEDLITRS